jgi:eukaryotic-like serine/threonine-protein kinase
MNTSGISREKLISGGGNSLNSDALIGKLIADRYIILGSLGSGAMGTVYKARHKHLNREVALKLLKRDVASDELSRKRFANEAKAASSLNHQNLIAVTDFGFAEGLGENGKDSPFLVMDYVHGQSLAFVLKQQKELLDEQFLNVMVQICAGLAHAHEKGLVHRDLKPSNILITLGDDGQDVVKVVDFGLAKAINAEQDLTTTGQIFGTPLYMSPEQCQGRKLDERSDIYSLGCLMYRMLAGQLPFTGDTPVTTIIMHVKEDPPPIPEDKLTSEFKRAIVPIIFKALEKDRAARHQSVNELRIELISAMEGITGSVAAEPTTQSLLAVPEDPPVNRRKMIAVIAACTLIPLFAVAAVLAWMLMHHHGDTIDKLHDVHQQASAPKMEQAAVVAPAPAPVPVTAPVAAPAAAPDKPAQPVVKPVAKPVKKVVRNRRAAATKSTTHAAATKKKKKSLWQKLKDAF